MWTIQDLARKYSISERKVRLRLTALDGLLQGHTFVGDFGKTLIDDYGLKVFDRLMELERLRISTSSAVNKLSQELGESRSGTPNNQFVNPKLSDPYIIKLVEQYEARIASLEHDKAYLQQLLAETQAKLQAMLPGTKSKCWWQFWR